MAVTSTYEPTHHPVSANSKCLRPTYPSARENTPGPPIVDYYAHIGEKIARMALNTTYAVTITMEALVAETLG